MKVIGLAFLYQPLSSLKQRIRTLNGCMLRDVLIYWVDCSPPSVFSEVRRLIESECQFGFRLEHLPERVTPLWTWNHIIKKTRDCTQYFTPLHLDEVQDPLYFVKMTSFLDEHPELVAASCPSFVTDTQMEGWPLREVRGVLKMVPDLALDRFSMWRASVHDVVGLFDQGQVSVGQRDLWDRVRNRFGGSAIGVHPETLGAQLLDGSSHPIAVQGGHGDPGYTQDQENILRRAEP